MQQKKKKSGLQRENILEAAAWLFKRKSYVRTSLDEVASRAGIKKATIFYYFSSKEHLLHEVLCECAKRGLERHRSSYDPYAAPQESLAKVIKGHLIFNIRDGFGGISTFEQKNLSPGLRKSYTALRDEYEQFFREVVQKAMAAGQMRQGNPQLQARLILGMVNSVSHWFKPSLPLSIEDVGDEICKLILLASETDNNSQ
ncbi:MAG: TetR/AcrR family transcriptional regulator [Thermodesulfobacteriota bacterium]|nr:TetR/AcrR family transcriptional regulator [Thermodesulfobacteriota bacterium]